MLDLGIVIVNYRTSKLLSDCLTSVFASQGDLSYRVCVVDNCSRDESCALVEKESPQVQLVPSQINGGFPCTNNLGLRRLGFDGTESEPAEADQERSWPRYVLLLNPDTVLLPTALADMVAFMDEHADAAVAGPRLVRRDGSLARRGTNSTARCTCSTNSTMQ